jgi:electron transport complex protein RnfB
MDTQLIQAIDALLPQTQCTSCGYPDCRAYATAIAREQASYDQCPPGGQAGVRRIAEFLGKPEIPLNPEYGQESPRTTAVIDEQRCIGCKLCIQACPVDAIMGSAKRMHTVLTAYCTGCDLCLPPCPVDCIEMVQLSDLAAHGNDAATRLLDLSIDEVAPVARRRYQAHQSRTEREGDEREQRLKAKSNAESSEPGQGSQTADSDRKKTIISSALARARAHRAETDRARRKAR